MPRYVSEAALCLQKQHREMQLQFDELRNALDLVGFESEVSDVIV